MTKISKKSVMFFLISILFFVTTIILSFVFVFKSNSKAAITNSVNNAESVDYSKESEHTNFDNIPNNLKAIYLTPGVDFYTNDNSSVQDLEKEIDEILENVLSLDFNSVIVKVNDGDKVIHSSENIMSYQQDALAILLEKAKQKQIGVYTVLSVYNNKLKDNTKITSYMSSENLDFISKYFNEFNNKYDVNGILLSDYNVTHSKENYNLYKSYSLGIEYYEWLKNTNSYFIKNISDSLKMDKENKAVGLYSSSVWANKASNSYGSDTNSSYQSLINGFSDTKMFIENNYVDYVLVEAFSSLTDVDVPFEKVINWWNEISSNSNKKYFVLHSIDKVGSNEQGWNGVDQVVRQVASAIKTNAYGGSAFYGYKKLMRDEGGSTTALLKFYRDEYKESDLFKNLTITYPTSTYTETYEDKIRFTGKYDPQFDVFINGEKIIPTASGEFLMDYDLAIGDNSFEVSHKGQIKTYKVLRRVEIIKSVSPTGKLSLDGGTQLDLEVVAYRDANITASIGGTHAKLSEFNGSDDINSNSVYVKYKGFIVLPNSGKTDKNLGSIKFTGKYGSLSESKYGASVIIEKLPDVNNGGNVSNGGSMDGVTPVTGNLLEISSTYADVFNAKSTASYADPRMYTIPKYTMDYYSKTSTISGLKYYITKSGRRIKASEAKMTNISSKGNNSINSAKIINDGVSTSIVISQNWKVPFNITFNNLPSSNTLTSFVSNIVTVTFDYTTVAPNIDLSGITNNSIFSGAKWEKTISNNIPQFKLNLTLRKSGAYYGASSYYDSNGNLIIKFNNSPKSLSGLRVVIDPGHGSTDPGSIGKYTEGGKTYIINESTLNWNLANELKNKLQAQGAIVKMLDSNNSRYVGTTGLYNRVKDAQDFNPHITLAVHHNSASSTNATGVETYYNSPFSKTLAKSINDSLGSYYNGTMYNDGKNRNRGDKFSEFLVTRVKTHASVLIEYGFLSNPIELKKLNSIDHVRGLAQATVNGLIKYINLAN